MSDLLLTPAQVRVIYDEIKQHPELVADLSAYQKSKIREYANEQWGRALEWINQIMIANPNYQYPPDLNGRYIEYWTPRYNHAADAKRVLAALDAYDTGNGLNRASAIESNEQNPIHLWIYWLRQQHHQAKRPMFSHTADGVDNLKILSQTILQGFPHFQEFADALASQLRDPNSWQQMEAHLKAEFLPGIKHYYDWYTAHSDYRAYFGEGNAYDVLFALTERTEREISKYFPITPTIKSVPAPLQRGTRMRPYIFPIC